MYLPETNYFGIIRPGEFIRTLAGGAQTYVLDTTINTMYSTQTKAKGRSTCLAIATEKFKRARSTRETAKAIKAIATGQNEMRFVLALIKDELVWFQDADLVRVDTTHEAR